MTKLKPFEIVTGHLDPSSPFDIEIEKRLLNNYIENHKDKVKILYENINQKIIDNKEKTIGKQNENREELPEIPENIFVKNRQKQSKTKNKYKPEKLVSINKDRKTGKIVPQHFNTQQNIHLSNIKRPKKKTYKFKKLSG